MPYDQVRTENALRHPTTGMLRDNTSGLITPQVARDEHVSTRDFARVKSHRTFTSSTTLTIDVNRGDVQEILLQHSITEVDFVNRGRVNLIWPNTDLQHSNWIIGSATTVTAGFTGPTGLNDAYRIQMPTGLNTSTRIAFEARNFQNFTAMSWVKENGVGSGVSIGFSNTVSDQTQSGTNITPTSSWARYQHTWTADVTATRYMQLDNQANATVVDVLVWRPQLYCSDIFPDPQIFEDTLFDTTSAPFGDATVITLILKQDSVGSRTINWPTNVMWPGGANGIPVLTDTANGYDIVTLLSPDGGVRWFGAVGGQDFA